MKHIIISLFAITLISSCASAPFDLEKANRSITPQLAKSSENYQGQTVVWGGLIIQTENFTEQSQIEVLAYPLDEYGEPQRHSQAQGRFLIKQSGFLEPAQYAAGRWISVIGSVAESKQGQVGQAAYRYPQVNASQLHLWPTRDESDSRTRFHFGIGIGL